MSDLPEALEAHLAAIARAGSLTPQALRAGRPDAGAVLAQVPGLAPCDAVREYFARVDGFDPKRCSALGLFEPVLAWDMFPLSLETALRHYEDMSECGEDEADDYWPAGFLPLLRDGCGDYVLVNLAPGTRTIGAVYVMNEGVGCNRLAGSLAEFFRASAQEADLGLRRYRGDESARALPPAEWQRRAAPLFGHPPYFSRPGRMDTQIVDWR